MFEPNERWRGGYPPRNGPEEETKGVILCCWEWVKDLGPVKRLCILFLAIFLLVTWNWLQFSCMRANDKDYMMRKKQFDSWSSSQRMRDLIKKREAE